MSKLLISTGTNPNDGNGDTLLAGAGKVNSNFNELYSSLGNGSDLNIGVGKTVISTNSSGNVGVGTTDPTSKFTVKGNTSLETLNVSGTLSVSDVSNFTSSVGIGTTNPQASIHTVVSVGRALFETNSSGINSILNLWNNNSSTSAGTGMLFSAGAGTSGITSFIGGVSAGRIGDTNNSLLAFRVLSNGVLTDLSTTAPFYVQGNSSGATVVSNANVGIGTTIPTSKLQVVGDVLISGITTIGLGSTSSPPQNSQLTFELTSNTNLRIKVRGTDGVIRMSNITLAP